MSKMRRLSSDLVFGDRLTEYSSFLVKCNIYRDTSYPHEFQFSRFHTNKLKGKKGRTCFP